MQDDRHLKTVFQSYRVFGVFIAVLTIGLIVAFCLAGSSKSAAYPPVLSAADARAYRTVFAAQDRGDYAQADARLKNIRNDVLFGAVYAQRYISSSYRADFSDLKIWMDRFADRPEAERIYKLAMQRKPAGFKGELKTPVHFVEISPLPSVFTNKTPEPKRSADQTAKMRALNSSINSLIANLKIKDAIQQLEKTSKTGLLTQRDYDRLQAAIAKAALQGGQPTRAYALARLSAIHSGDKVPEAAWIAGLAAWRKGYDRKAEFYFAQAAHSAYADDNLKAAAFYWAGRAARRQGRGTEGAYFANASSYQHDFYGLIAAQIAPPPDLNAATLNRLRQNPALRRAKALIEAGRPVMAEEELKAASCAQRDLKPAIEAFARAQGLSAFAPKSNETHVAALPRLVWAPQNGFTVDPLLIQAIAHRESRFDPAARSFKGASGLMQIMPDTADEVAEDLGRQSYNLDDPRTNIAFGQRYIENLLKDSKVQGNLISLLVAYNAGPGKLARWKETAAPMDDDLYFMESLPSAETRAYVRNVLRTYWMLALQNGETAPSLEALAIGKAPLYADAGRAAVQVADSR